ncbi:helix-turn-helix transcriptional regulator [Streptacidiphilus sp. 4-A2]|nr:helix-turn-helix transcriptional regulator [Streptacidiphilus sp. 4-A2]
MWRWATPAAQEALGTRNLGTILRYYREQQSLSQTALGVLLGYEKPYVSMLENGRRTITDVVSLRRIATALSLPPHVLGVTDPADTDVAAMLQFGDSTIRLAEIARQSGHASAAVNELWPLVARLEARVADGHCEREVLELLARARTSLGVALGHILPEERLATAARWTGQGVAIACHLDDRAFHSTALRMHGNELRKAGLMGAALDRLRHAVSLAVTPDERAAVLPLPARAAGEAGATTCCGGSGGSPASAPVAADTARGSWPFRGPRSGAGRPGRASRRDSRLSATPRRGTGPGRWTDASV